MSASSVARPMMAMPPLAPLLAVSIVKPLLQAAQLPIAPTPLAIVVLLPLLLPVA